MNFLINIAGPSGVGKTTIAHLIMSINDYDSSIVISGDDSHKWERNDKNWNKYTHLNPFANNLDEEAEQLKILKNNLPITRKCYNHSTGIFDQPKIINPKKTIIYEGLHGLYQKNIRDLADLKIYVDTDEELKIAWKIKRDLKKRGYTEKQVLEAINKRINDEIKYILPQKEYADVVVRFTFDESEGVIFEYQLKNPKYFSLFEKIKHFYNLKKEFIKISKCLSEDDDYLQNKGGNISVKYSKKMLITSSGYEIKNLSMFEGVCVVESENPSNIIYSYGKPSMESMAHSFLGTSVIHTHPVDLLPILCSQEGEEIVNQLYRDYRFQYVEYTPPGLKLYEKLKKNNNIIFCQNHGIFISTDNLKESYLLTKEVCNIAKKYINSKNTKVHEFLETDNFLTPDSIILREQNKNLNNTIYKNIINCGLTPKFLADQEKEYLLQMEEEKYRSIK